MNLFEQRKFISHSGKELYWKIECDSLTDEDIETLAYVVGKNFLFADVVAIPTGGIRLANALKKYTAGSDILRPTLVVDDVITTGKSMIEKLKTIPYSFGVVIFDRSGKEHDFEQENIFPIFKLNSWLKM